jgi:phosphoglycolate phosphatase
MNFDLYIFDLDGTLLDLGNIGFHADQILVNTLKKLDVTEIPLKVKRDKLWSSGGNFKNVLSQWGLSDSNKFWKVYDKTDFEKRKALLNADKIKLFQDTTYMLDLIYNHQENKKLAICSNTANYIVNFFLKHFKINQYFHEIFSMGENNQKFAKPSPKGILSIMRKLKINSKLALMIGDSIHDIKAARNAKISSCLFDHQKKIDNYWYKHWEIQPDYVIKNLRELSEL